MLRLLPLRMPPQQKLLLLHHERRLTTLQSQAICIITHLPLPRHTLALQPPQRHHHRRSALATRTSSLAAERRLPMLHNRLVLAALFLILLALLPTLIRSLPCNRRLLACIIAARDQKTNATQSDDWIRHLTQRPKRLSHSRLRAAPLRLLPLESPMSSLSTCAS